jgi:hypothetical protein
LILGCDLFNDCYREGMTQIAPLTTSAVETVSSFSCDILASSQDTVEKALNVLLKKAQRSGLSFSWVFGKAFWKTVDVRKQDGELVERNARVFCLPLDVSGDFRIALPGGWRLVGSIANIDGVIVQSGDVPYSARTNWQHCDHCNTQRRRNKTFMVRNAQDETKMVGSSCMTDFLGADVDRAILAFSIWSDIVATCSSDETDGYGGSGESSRFPLEGLLALSYAVISTYGFVAKSKENMDTGNASTATRVALILNKKLERPTVTEDHTARAVLAIEWAESLSDSECEASSYLANLREIAKSNMASHRLLGLAVSICKAYDVAMEKAQAAIEAETAPKSQYVGIIGERQSFTVQCTHISRPFDTGFGWNQFYTFKTAEGNILTWKTSAGIQGVDGAELTVSPVEFVITGRVERHEVGRYSNQQETNLSRAKLTAVGTVATPKKRAAKKVA